MYDLRQNANKYLSQVGEIYGSFNEGFDSPDLVRAKARLRNAGLDVSISLDHTRVKTH
jgi:hypothetical protein